MPTEIILPKSRVVAGNTTDWTEVKDDNGVQKTDKRGNALFSNWVYLAVPKQDFMNNVWATMVAEASKVYKNAANIHPDNYENDGFAWKIIDGDSQFPPKKKPNSAPYNKREGFPGNYIIKVNTYAFLPDTVVFQNGAYRKIEAGQIKTGDYVVASVTLDTRSDSNGMGFYWNPSMYELVELGEEIIGESSKDPNKILGDASNRTHSGFQGSLPTAMPQQPQAPTAMPQQPQAPTAMPQQPQAPTAMPQQPQAPTAMPQQPQAPTAMPAPAHDFVQNVTGGQPNQAPLQQPGIPVQPVAHQQPNAVPPAIGTAPAATTYPTNVPGLPPVR